MATITKANSKTAPENPFQAIQDLETAEEQRFAKEVEDMRKEEIELQESLAAKEASAEASARSEVEKELQEFETRDLPPILKKAETDAIHDMKRIDEVFAKNKDVVANSLIEQCTEGAFLLHS
jgi:hypothetical protein